MQDAGRKTQDASWMRQSRTLLLIRQKYFYFLTFSLLLRCACSSFTSPSLVLEQSHLGTRRTRPVVMTSDLTSGHWHLSMTFFAPSLFQWNHNSRHILPSPCLISFLLFFYFFFFFIFSPPSFSILLFYPSLPSLSSIPLSLYPSLSPFHAFLCTCQIHPLQWTRSRPALTISTCAAFTGYYT